MFTTALYPCAEVFGGVGEIAQNDGFCFEQRRDSNMNIHSEAGMKCLARGLALTEPGGLVVVEPTASSYLSFVSVNTTKRTPEP